MAAHDVLAKWKRNNNDPTKFVLLPQYLLNKQAVEALRKSYEPYLAARAEALKAIPLKTGWYSLNLSLDMSEESFRKNPVPTQVMNVGMYLRGLAILQIQDGNLEDAWQTTLAILAVARSFGDQPGSSGIFMRESLQRMAPHSFERCLGQGAVADPMLAEAMKALSDEANAPLFYWAFRCERVAFTNY